MVYLYKLQGFYFYVMHQDEFQAYISACVWALVTLVPEPPLKCTA